MAKLQLRYRKIISSIRDWDIKGSGRLSYFLSKLLLPEPTESLVIETIYGFKIKIDPVIDNGVERAIYDYGTYEKGTLDIISQLLLPGDTFVDVGANIGLMSIFSGLKVGSKGKVIAFEPNPNTRLILEENIRLNELEKTVKIEQKALSNETKKSNIYDRWDVNRGGASLIKPKTKSTSYEIEETTFSTYFSINKKIKIIKIDVEGYELEVLKGAKEYLTATATPPVLIVEFSSDRINTFGTNTSPLFEFLQSFGFYRIFKTTKGKERISKLVEITSITDLPRHDNIYCFTEENIHNLPKTFFK